MRHVLRLLGQPVRHEDVPFICDRLRAYGRALDLDLAARLERAVEDEVAVLGLSVDERTAVLTTLEDCSDSLAGLRGALWRERCDRGPATG